MKTMTPANVRAMEATWPLEMIVCKRIAEVIADGRPTAFQAQNGEHRFFKYKMGRIQAIAGDRNIVVAYSHAGAFQGSEHAKGIMFRVGVKNCVSRINVTISEEDFNDADQRAKMIEFIGNRTLHAIQDPEKFHLTGAAGPSINDGRDKMPFALPRRMPG